MKEITKKIIKKEFNYNQEKKSLTTRNTRSKKILAVFDGYKFSQSTLDYAIQLTKEADAFLVGVFLDESFYRSYNTLQILKTHKDAEQILLKLDTKDQEKRDAAVTKFQKACGQAGVAYTFHRNKDIAIHELKQESIYADLIIINDSETFSRVAEDSPTRFIKELLADVQCPVLVVPNKFIPIDKIILLYDGAPSSVFAIKMFSYVLNGMGDLPVEVFTVKDKKGTSHVSDNKLMKEFIKRHFPKVKFVVAKGNPEEEIVSYLRNHKENELVVLGAYRRTEISRWFKASMADILIKELDTALFIAHNK